MSEVDECAFSALYFLLALVGCGAAAVPENSVVESPAVESSAVTLPAQAPARMEVTSLGGLEVCSVDSNGGLWCSDRSDMALADGRDAPPAFIGEGYESVAASSEDTCALTAAIHEVSRPPGGAQPQDRERRQLRCWRRIHHDSHDARILVVSLSVRAELSKIAIAYTKVCVFGDAPSACVVFNMASTPLPNIQNNLDHLSFGNHHACWSRARIEEVVCSGPLSEVAAPRVCDSRIASGGEFSCCQSGGELVCWGLEEFRVRWDLAHSITSIAAGDRHFCYVDTGGAVYCGGDCSEGDCGDDGSSSWLDEPVRLNVPSPAREVLISGETWVVLRSGERLSFEHGAWRER